MNVKYISYGYFNTLYILYIPVYTFIINIYYINFREQKK